jgi:hypothetical protein
MKTHAARIAPLVLTALLSACAATPLSSPGEGAKAVQSGEVMGQNALPAGAVLKPAQSLIMGAGDQWVGRVVADVGRDTELAYRFFLESYPAQGWTLVSAVRGKTSLIVLTRQDRTATVELSEGSLLSSGTAVLTVSPRNAQVSAPRRP